MIINKKIFFFVFTCLLHHSLQAQEMVNVVLVNSKTLEPVPFASIFIFNIKHGNYSDENGRCTLPVNALDTVFISSIGFKSKKLVIHSTAIDSIFIDPYVNQLLPVTVSRRISIDTTTFGIMQAKVDLRWGPSGGGGEEYAQLINIPADGDVIVKFKKIILHAEYFNPATPVLLHIYSVNEVSGLPDKDLLQTKYIITARNFIRRKVIVDLDAENLYLTEKKIFVG